MTPAGMPAAARKASRAAFETLLPDFPDLPPGAIMRAVSACQFEMLTGRTKGTDADSIVTAARARLERLHHTR